MKRRIFAISLLILVFCCTFALPVFANSPGPISHFCAYIINPPQKACYLDLLVPLSPEDSRYITNFQKEKYDLPENAPIFSYNQDGYVSYTFHYKNAQSEILIQFGMAYYFENTDENLALFDNVKLAVLGEQGNIIKVSEAFSPQTSGFLSVSSGEVHYDYMANTVEVKQESITPALIIFAIFSALGMVVTVFLEWIVSLFFSGIIRYSKTIVFTNIITQLLLRVLQIVLFSFVLQNYWLWLIVLEILVYSGEFLLYRKKMQDVSWKKILLYTVIANTVTLVLGLFINNIFY